MTVRERLNAESSFLLTVLVAAFLATGCKTTQRSTVAQAPRASSSQTVEVGCATCIFQMEGVVGCKLAVRIDGHPYLVTGSDIDDHGDAHAPDGLCNAARRARVEGEIDGDRYVATKIALQP